MQYVVTGGAGFIGSHLVDALLAQGHTVVVVDDFSTGSQHNLPRHERLTFVKRNICYPIDDLIPDGAVIFHLAAITSLQYSLDHPDVAHATNVNGTFSVLCSAERRRAKRVILASSAAVYGEQLPPLAEDLPVQLLSPYAVHKVIGETYAQYFYRRGMETVCLRFFNVYGLRQSASSGYASLLSACLSRLRAGKSPIIYGDGEQTRDFIFVGDVVDAIIRATTADCAGRIINICSGTSITVNEVVRIMLRHADLQLVPVHAPPRDEVRDSCGNNTLAKQLLDWSPRVAPEEGIAVLMESRCVHAAKRTMR